MFHVELRGVPITGHADVTISQGSISITRAIGERPRGAIRIRIPEGSALDTPQDWDELTIDYPARPYRAEAEALAPVAYWRLDERASTRAIDSVGVTNLDYLLGVDTEHRAYEFDGAAVPYGGAPEWGHSAGAGLSGTLPDAIGALWTIAGFLRLRTSAVPPLRSARAARPPRAPVSVFDASIVPGWSDPDVANATPGVALAFERTEHDPGREEWLQQFQYTNLADQRIPPSHIESGAQAFVGEIRVAGAPDRRFTFRLASTASSDPGLAGPQFTDLAESNLAIICQADDGSIFAFRIADEVADDDDEPYLWFIDGQDAAYDAFRTALIANVIARAVIVDTSHANIDFDNAQVASATALDDAEAPTVAINAIPAGDEGTDVTLGATVSGGTYDTLEYAWAVPAGTLDDAALAAPTWTRPQVTADTDYQPTLTVTARGTGTLANDGTEDTATATAAATTVQDVPAVQPLALPATVDQVATVGVPFSLTLPEATGGVTPYIYITQLRPAGINFDANTRVLSGTPTTIQSRNVRYRVEDDDGTRVTDRFIIDVQAAPAQPLALPGTADQAATVGTPFSLTLPEATDGAPPYAYTAANLPAGLAFDVNTRVLSGTPTTAQTRTVTYQVEDDDGTTESDDFDIVVSAAAQPLALPATADQVATVGTLFSLTLPMATGGATPYAYTATNLPAGLAFDATSRVLSGTPTAAQTRAVDYQVTDDDGDSESDQFDIVVSAAVPALALPATADQTARVGVLFSITLPEATGGVTPYAYTATNRPAGLVFNASTRVLSGTPTTIQTRAVRYRVTDDDGAQVDDFFDVDVLAAPTSAGDVVLAAGSLTVSADRALGQVSVELGSDTLVGAVPVDEWAHVAVRLSAAALELWVDGVQLGTAPAPAGAVLDGEAIEMAVAGGAAVDMALDEWGVWDTAIDVADLAARARHRRYFGGYIYGIADETITGPIDEHVVNANLGGYGLRLDGSFVRRTFATASGASLRSIVSDVIDDAGLTGVFDPHGVSLDDTVPRAVYPVRSVMAILRELANDHGAIVTVDEWRSINIVRRADVEHVDLVLRGAPGANVRSIKRVTEPRFFANRVVVIGRDTPGSYEDKFAIDGVSRVWDLTHQPEEVKAIRIDGVDQAFGDDGDPYIADLGQARIELDAAAPTPASGQMEVLYSVTSDLVVTQDNQAAIDAIGFPIAKRYEDDAIDTPSVARVKAAAYLDRHDQPFEYYQLPRRLRAKSNTWRPARRRGSCSRGTR